MVLSKESKDAVFLMLLQGMNYLIPLFTVPYLLVKLGATGYGFVGFAFAYTSYFTMIVEFGFNLSGTKRMIEASERGHEHGVRVFSSTLTAKLALFGLSVIPFWFLPYLLPPIEQYAATIHAMFPMLAGQSITLTWFYQSIGKIRVIAFFTALSRVLILPLIFVVVKTPDDYIKAALVQSCSVLGSGLISMIYLVATGRFHFRWTSVSEVIGELKESVPLFLSTVATSLYTQLFTLFLGFISTAYVVGLYSAAERIIRTICFSIYTPVAQSFYPKVTRLALHAVGDAKRLCRRLIGFFALVLGGVAVVVFIFAPEIGRLLGSDYAELPQLLRILALLPLIIAVGGVFGQMGLVGMGDRKSKNDFRRVYFIAGVISLSVIFPLGYWLLATGAAIALIISELCVTLLMFHYCRKNNLSFYCSESCRTS